MPTERFCCLLCCLLCCPFYHPEVLTVVKVSLRSGIDLDLHKGKQTIPRKKASAVSGFDYGLLIFHYPIRDIDLQSETISLSIHSEKNDYYFPGTFISVLFEILSLVKW
uniref:Uncharacterized protein n=1 Tax=Cacopsylla melanoneura TaxID=428564 RepID=A0A8D8ZFV6_9HEMI